MELLNHLALGFSVALTPINIIYALIGSLLGTLIGVLPGHRAGRRRSRCCCRRPTRCSPCPR